MQGKVKSLFIGGFLLIVSWAQTLLTLSVSVRPLARRTGIFSLINVSQIDENE
ncbi:MAG: hypothetical protein GYA55_06130 [SAR324 cluster bacterium]|uniref:Uncharacterized protein n=1 Tax=SAR324 cluster bacterium TaxID=2024889 RepID=A0A7X9FR11_9DELT|nr:hypothetical protein [SAR324 cluster bacterium]